MFADDTKPGGAADSLEEQEALQSNPYRLEHWAVINGMKVQFQMLDLHLGRRNVRHKYELGEECLQSSPAEGNLAVLVDSRLRIAAVSLNASRGGQQSWWKC